MPAVLNESQVKQLAERLARTQSHVYNTAQTMFGVRPGEEIFTQLYNAGVAKCVECEHWLFVSDFAKQESPDDDIPMACESCLNGEDD